jgi:hypothetical protein
MIFPVSFARYEVPYVFLGVSSGLIWLQSATHSRAGRPIGSMNNPSKVMSRSFTPVASWRKM